MNQMNKSIITGLFSALLLVSACKKDKTSSPSSPSSPSTTDTLAIGTIQAKIDDTLRKATNYVKFTILSTGNLALISGTGGPNTDILTYSINIGDFKGVGTYALGVYDAQGLGVNASYTRVSYGSYSCTPNYSETSGSVTVTEYIAGDKIKGKFNFKGRKLGSSGSGKDAAEIKDGEFYISLK